MGIDWSKKRVLVTGGAGFLGSHVVAQLRARGCKDIFVVRRRDFDLTQEEAVKRLYAEHPAEIVVHLAGLVGGIAPNSARPAEYFYQNIMMGVLIMHYAWKSGAEKFVCAGAGCGYPEDAPLPLNEENFWQGFPQEPSFAYSLAKRMLHVQAMAYWKQYRFPAIVTIPGNIYGPYDNFNLEDAHVIPALVRKFVDATSNGTHDCVEVWGSGDPTRDFVYAGDVAEGMLRAAEVYDRSELVNLSSGCEHSVRDVVNRLVQITGFRSEVIWETTKPEGQRRRVFDISKAVRELGYVASTSLEQGLADTVAWYRGNQNTARN
jgi:GDP-L-fucose synthase